MKTGRREKSGEKMFSKSGRMKETLQANLEEYENDVLNQ